jgi:hypothetical protein
MARASEKGNVGRYNRYDPDRGNWNGVRATKEFGLRTQPELLDVGTDRFRR